jgi:hypothetical protein
MKSIDGAFTVQVRLARYMRNAPVFDGTPESLLVPADKSTAVATIENESMARSRDEG